MDPIKDALIEYFSAKGKPISPEVAQKVSQGYKGDWDGLRRDLQSRYKGEFDAQLFNQLYIKGKEVENKPKAQTTIPYREGVTPAPVKPVAANTETAQPQQESSAAPVVQPQAPREKIERRSGLDYAAAAADESVQMTQDNLRKQPAPADPIVAPPLDAADQIPTQVDRRKIQQSFDPVQQKTVEMAPVALPELPQNAFSPISKYNELPGFEQYYKDNTGEDYLDYQDAKASSSKTGKVEQYGKMGEKYLTDLSEYSNFLFAEVMDKAGFTSTEEIKTFNESISKISDMIEKAKEAGDDKAVEVIVKRHEAEIRKFQEIRETPGYLEYERHRTKLDAEAQRYYKEIPQDVRDAGDSLKYIQSTIDKNDAKGERGFWNNSGSFAARFLARTANRIASLGRDPLVQGALNVATLGASSLVEKDVERGLAAFDGITDDFIAEYQTPTRRQRGAWENVGQFEGMDLIFDNRKEKIIGVYDSKTGNKLDILIDLDQLKQQFLDSGGKIEEGKFGGADRLWTKGTDVLLDLIPQIAIARLTGRGLTGIGIGKEAAATAAVMGSTYAQVQSDFYRTAIEVLQDDEQAGLMALGQSAAVGAIALISPLEKQMAGLTASTLTKGAIKRSIETAVGGGLKLAKNDLIQLGKNIGVMTLAGAGETFEEVAEYFVPERMMPAIVNQVTAGEVYNNLRLNVDPNELKEIAAISMGVGVLGKGGVLANKNSALKALESFASTGELNNELLNHLLNGEKHIDFILDELVKKKVITQNIATAIGTSITKVQERAEQSKDLIEGKERSIKPVMFIAAFEKEVQSQYDPSSAEGKQFAAAATFAEDMIGKILNNEPISEEQKPEAKKEEPKAEAAPEPAAETETTEEPGETLKPILLDEDAAPAKVRSITLDDIQGDNPGSGLKDTDRFNVDPDELPGYAEILQEAGFKPVGQTTTRKGLFGKKKTVYTFTGKQIKDYLDIRGIGKQEVKPKDDIEDAEVVEDITPDPEPKRSPVEKTEAAPEVTELTELEKEGWALILVDKMNNREQLKPDELEFVMENPDLIRKAKLKTKPDDKNEPAVSGPSDTGTAKSDPIVKPKPEAKPEAKKEEPVAVQTKPAEDTEVEQDEDEEQDTDINEARRKRGKFILDGITFTRPTPDKAKSTGKKGKVFYADDIAAEYEWALIEEEDLQPAHYRGQRNRKNFIPEAQPKDRRGADSAKASDKIADNIEVGRLLESEDAYHGSPTVLATGELVQGNNRAEGIKKHYQSGKTTYKEQLAARAADIGATPEQVMAMNKPVAVRVLKVDDDTAIEYGNYEASDLESGGNVRIDPVRTARKIPMDKKKDIAVLLAQKNTTFAQSIRESFGEIMKILKPKYINSARFRSLINSKGEPSSTGIKDLEGLIKEFLFVGADPELSNTFDALPSFIQEGLIKSVPYILSTGKKNTIRPEIQQAIQIIAEYHRGKYTSFPEYKGTPDMFKGGTPDDVYNKTSLAIAEKILEFTKEKEVINLMYEYNAAVSGVNDMFEVIPAMNKKDAVAATFGQTATDETVLSDREVNIKPGELEALMKLAMNEGFFNDKDYREVIRTLILPGESGVGEPDIKKMERASWRAIEVYNNLVKTSGKETADKVMKNAFRLASMIQSKVFNPGRPIIVKPGVKAEKTGNKTLDSIIEKMEAAADLLSNYHENVEVVYEFTQKEVEAGAAAKFRRVRDPQGNVTKIIVFITNRKGLDEVGTARDIYHEVMHGVETQLRNTNPEARKKFGQDMLALIAEYPDIAAYIKRFAVRYTRSGPDMTIPELREIESIVEFFAMVATGEVKLNQRQQTVVERFIDQAISLFEKALKLPKGSIKKLLPQDRSRIIDMSNTIAHMLREGKDPVPFIINQYSGSRGSKARAESYNNLTARGFSQDYAERRIAAETKLPVDQIRADVRDDVYSDDNSFHGYDPSTPKREGNNNPRVEVNYSLFEDERDTINGMLKGLIQLGKYNINDILNKVAIATNTPLSEVKNVYFSERMDARSGDVIPRTWMDRFMNDMSISAKVKDKITREGYLYEEITNDEAYARAEELVDAYIKGYGDVDLALETLYTDILENSSDKPGKPGLNPAIAVFAYMQIIRRADANGNEDLAARVATYKAYLGTIKGQFIQALRGTAGPDNLISIAFEEIDKRRNRFLGTQLRSGRNFTDILNEFKDAVGVKQDMIDKLKGEIGILLKDIAKANQKIQDLIDAMGNMVAPPPAPGTTPPPAAPGTTPTPTPGTTPGTVPPAVTPMVRPRRAGQGPKKSVSAPRSVKAALNKISAALFGTSGAQFSLGIDMASEVYEAVGEMFLGLLESNKSMRGQPLINKVAQLLAELEDADGNVLTEEEIIDMIYGGLNDSSTGMLVKDQIKDNTNAMPLDPSLLINRMFRGTNIEEIVKEAIDFTYSKENRAGMTLAQVIMMDPMMPQDEDSIKLAKDIEGIITKDLTAKMRNKIQKEVAEYAKNPDTAAIFSRVKRNPTKMERLIEAVSMGMLSNKHFGKFAADIFADITPIPPDFIVKVEKVVKDIKIIGDITGSKELKNVKIRELASMLNEIKPAFAPGTIFDELYTVLVNGALTGLNTIFNANIAGVLAAIPKLSSSIIYRPGASWHAFRSYQKMLKGTGRRSFVDAVATNFSSLDSLGTFFDSGNNQRVSLSEYLAVNGVGMLFKRAKEAKGRGDTMQMVKEYIAAGIMAPAIVTWRTAFLLKAFDAMYVHRLGEFFGFIEAYDQVARGTNNGFIPTIQNWAGRKSLFDEVDKMLGYDQAMKAIHEQKIEDEIAELEADGVDLTKYFKTFGGAFGYKKRRLKELMTEGEAADIRYRGISMAKDAIMMGSPTGLPGMAYANVNRLTNFDRDDALSSGSAFAAKAIFGMFIRITANTVNRYFTGSPVGFAFNLVNSVRNRLMGKVNTKWVPNEMFQQTPLKLRGDQKNYIQVSNQEMAQRLITGMLSIAGYFFLNSLMFDDDDELLPEDERIIDVTAQMSGNYFKNLESEPNNEEASIRVKWFGNEWSDPLKYVYVPDFGFTIALIGGKRDWNIYQNDTNKNKNPPGLKPYMAASTLAYFSNLSFAANFGSIKKAMDAYSAAQRDPELGMKRVSEELLEIIARPTRTLMMSNLARDVIMESRIAYDKATGSNASVIRNNSGIKRFTRDLPYVELLTSDARIDQFGYPIERKSKMKLLALKVGDVFSAGLASNAFNNFVEENKGRFETKAWRPAMKFDGTIVPGMWDPGYRFENLKDEDKEHIQKIFAENFRATVEKHHDKMMRRKSKALIEKDYERIAGFARDRATFEAQKLGFEPNTEIKKKPMFSGL